MANYTLAGGVNLDTLHVGDFVGMGIDEATASRLVLSSGGERVVFTGQSFTYDANQQIVGGTITGLSWTLSPGRSVDFTNLNVPVAQANQWFYADDTQAALTYALQGSDSISGSTATDLLRGAGGNDYLEGRGGADTIYGGAGDDRLYAIANGSRSTETASHYLRGDEGNDLLVGSPGFDDLNGNMGDDTLTAGEGNDWVVGGKDRDRLIGDLGDDIVYGNLGDDTCIGSAGADLVRGGQGDDTLSGDDGDDWISGDLGSDGMVGGAGADIFHSFAQAGLDRVYDFSVAQGDRVQLDPGTSYAVMQVGRDTVIDMGSENMVVLVGVDASTLPPGTIFVA